MTRLFVLSGGSGIGKTSLMHRLADSGVCAIAPKYSSRAVRRGLDDIIHVEAEFFATGPCDIQYDLYDTRYGIDSSALAVLLEKNNQVLTVSHREALSQLRDRFGELLVAICLYVSDVTSVRLIEAYVARGEIDVPESERHSIIELASEAARSRRASRTDAAGEAWMRFCQRIGMYFRDQNEFRRFVERYESAVDVPDVFCDSGFAFDYRFESSEATYWRLRALMAAELGSDTEDSGGRP